MRVQSYVEQDDANCLHCPNMINCRSFTMLKLIDQPTSHILCTPWMKNSAQYFHEEPHRFIPEGIPYTICF